MLSVGGNKAVDCPIGRVGVLKNLGPYGTSTVRGGGSDVNLNWFEVLSMGNGTQAGLSFTGSLVRRGNDVIVTSVKHINCGPQEGDRNILVVVPLECELIARLDGNSSRDDYYAKSEWLVGSSTTR